jgi:hypothetical protein
MSSRDGVHVVSQCPEDPPTWWLLRGAGGRAVAQWASNFAARNQNEFYNVHSLIPGQISRCVLHVSQRHRDELRKNKELDVVSTDPEAPALALALCEWYGECGTCVYDASGVHCGYCAESEIARTDRNSAGQDAHLDTMLNVRAGVLNCTPGSTSTSLANYHYQPWPQNVSAESTVPRNWNSLPTVNIRWKLGDLLMTWQNRIHWGPPNKTTKDRHIVFLGGGVPAGCAFSDSEVITEDVFHRVRRYAPRCLLVITTTLHAIICMTHPLVKCTLGDLTARITSQARTHTRV